MVLQILKNSYLFVDGRYTLKQISNGKNFKILTFPKNA